MFILQVLESNTCLAISHLENLRIDANNFSIVLYFVHSEWSLVSVCCPKQLKTDEFESSGNLLYLKPFLIFSMSAALKGVCLFQIYCVKSGKDKKWCRTKVENVFISPTGSLAQ
jgi:hypothetical protein